MAQQKFNARFGIAVGNGITFVDETGTILSGTRISWVQNPTVTSNKPLFDATQTWNGVGVKFDSIRVNITDTASAADSNLMDLQVAGASKFLVDKSGNTVLQGNLTVHGTMVTLNTSTVDVEDKNITLGKIVTPTNVTADGGGITLKGATDKTIIWDTTNANWTSSEHWNLVSGAVYKINNVSVLSSNTLGSGIVTSSLTTVGTIGTGVWQGSVVQPTYGGTGVNNGVKTITLGGNLTTSGAFALILTTTGATNVTLPTTGTIATLAGAETLTSKTLSTGSTWNGNLVTGTYGGTGVNNGVKTITLGGNLTTSGAFATTFTVTNTTSVTLPTTGTLATLAGTETLTSKTMSTGCIWNGNAITNTYLANSTIKIGATAVSLGGTITALTSLSNVDLTTGNTYKVAGVEVLSNNKVFQLPYSSTPQNSFSISGTSRASNVVTITTSAAHGFTVGQTVGIVGTIDSTVSGTSFTIVAVPTTTTFTYASNGINGTGGAGGYAARDILQTSFVTRDSFGNIWSSGTVSAGRFIGNLTGTATSIAGLTQWGFLYQSAAGTTASTNAGVAGQVLKSNATSAPTWVNGTISGVALGGNLNTLTLNVSGTGLSGSTTYNGSAAATFTVTSNATNLNTASSIVARDASGNFTAGTITAALTGNASTATTLQTARTINGTSFNGSANITLTANTTNTLTIGSYLTGTSFNGSAATTIAVDATTTASASKIVARDVNGYIFGTYANFTSGAIGAAAIGSMVVKNTTDSYYRDASAANVAAFISGQVFNTGGTALNATNVGALTSTSANLLFSNLRVSTTKGGYYGIGFGSDIASTPVIMFDGGGNGGVFQTSFGWHAYWSVTNQCYAIGTAITLPGYKLYVSGNEYVDGFVAASTYYDSVNTAYYVDPAGTSNLNIVSSTIFRTGAAPSYGYGLWGSDSNSYGIKMALATDTTYGGRMTGDMTSDYNMYFTMTQGSNRGFVFRNSIGNELFAINADGVRSYAAIRKKVSYTSASITIGPTHEVLICQGTITITLPAASVSAGLTQTVKNAGTGTITVDANASETIDGVLTLSIAPMQAVTMACDGGSWWII